MTTNYVKLTSVLPERLDERTIAFRYDEPRMNQWLGWTQAWRFEGEGVEGDALVVTVGRCERGDVRSLCAFRLGDKVTMQDVSDCGIVGLLRAHGLAVSVSL
jgi:hypothetical protein